jgi:hypothetical protein
MSVIPLSFFYLSSYFLSFHSLSLCVSSSRASAFCSRPPLPRREVLPVYHQPPAASTPAFDSGSLRRPDPHPPRAPAAPASSHDSGSRRPRLLPPTAVASARTSGSHHRPWAPTAELLLQSSLASSSRLPHFASRHWLLPLAPPAPSSCGLGPRLPAHVVGLHPGLTPLASPFKVQKWEAIRRSCDEPVFLAPAPQNSSSQWDLWSSAAGPSLLFIVWWGSCRRRCRSHCKSPTKQDRSLTCHLKEPFSLICRLCYVWTGTTQPPSTR